MSRILHTLILFALVGTVFTSGAVAEPQLNESQLWYGGDEGIATVFRTGKNLAYTKEDPKIDPRMTARAQSFDQALLRIGDRTYVAYGWALTNTTMVVGDGGVIIIDPPESVEAGPAVFAAFRTVTNLPVKAIVYTQNHLGHIAAVKAFATEKDVESGRVEIYAHESFMQSIVDRASTAGPIQVRRTAYTGAVFLPKGPDGPVHSALGPSSRGGPINFIPPTTTFSDQLDVVVAGVTMQLKYISSETGGETVAWFPEDGILHSAGIMQGENFPNLYTNRGTTYRDPLTWVRGIDAMRVYPADYLVPSHGRPVAGPDNVADVLTAYRDAIQFVHDQTIRYMNHGHTPDQLVELVVLPPHLAEHPWINEHYGTVKEAVRNIYNGYLGWFQADPWMLDPLPYKERAERTVQLMGGRDAVLGAARQAMDAQEYTWAAELLTPVIRMDINDMEARQLKAQAYREWAATVPNVTWRNWSLTAAAELEGDVTLAGDAALVSADLVQSMPSDVLLQVLTARVDPARSHDAHMTLGIRVPDANEAFGLELRRGVVQFHPQLPPATDVTVVADRELINRLLVSFVPLTGDLSTAAGQGPQQRALAIMAAIDSGDMQVEGGTSQDVERFFSYFEEPIDASSIKLVVR